MSNDADLKLVNLCLQGNKKAFEELIDKYQQTIFNVALRMVKDYDDAKDISQTVFIKALRTHEIRPTTGLRKPVLFR